MCLYVCLWGFGLVVARAEVGIVLWSVLKSESALLRYAPEYPLSQQGPSDRVPPTTHSDSAHCVCSCSGNSLGEFVPGDCRSCLFGVRQIWVEHGGCYLPWRCTRPRSKTAGAFVAAYECVSSTCSLFALGLSSKVVFSLFLRRLLLIYRMSIYRGHDDYFLRTAAVFRFAKPSF